MGEQTMLQQVTGEHVSMDLPFDLDHCPSVGDVMSRDVLTVRPTDRLVEAAQRMQDRSVSCVVVVSAEGVVGLLTLKDVLAALSETGTRAFDQTVAQRMPADLTWILPDQTVFEASAAMEARHIRHLPVLRAGHLVGIVTQTDLVRCLISFGSLRGVHEIMGRNVTTVDSRDTAQEAVDAMAARHLSCVVVERSGRPVGILTERDVVRHLVIPQRNPRDIVVETIMSAPLHTIDGTLSVHSAGRLMNTQGIHRLVVVDEGQLVGVVTQTDILTAVHGGLQAEQTALETQAAYREVKRQLIQSEKLATIGQLAAGVAHELNTPIGFVRNNLEALGKHVTKILELLTLYEQVPAETDPQARQDLLARIETQRDRAKLGFLRTDIGDLLAESAEGLEHVVSIVRTLRDFSRADTKDTRAPYDINGGIRSTLIVAHNALKYDVDVHLELGAVPEVPALAGSVNQVLLNLITNAAQALASQERSERGTITLRTYATEEHVVCEVTDNGPGIPPENLSRIFQAFFTTKPEGIGTGLGLSVSRDIIVERHHGVLDVTSQVDRGTTFTIRLPRRT